MWTWINSGHFAQSSRNGIPVHHRETDVQEDHVRREPAGGRDCAAAIVGQPRLVAETRDRKLQHLRSIHVVFDDQHAKDAARGDRRPFGRRRGGRLPPRSADESPPRSLARPRTSDADLPFVHFHQPSRQRQPDAQPTGRALEHRLRLMEHVEYPREDVGGDSDPGIADAHDGLVGLLVGGEPDVPCTRRELHRVVQDIGEDLHQPRTITVDENRARRRL